MKVMRKIFLIVAIIIYEVLVLIGVLFVCKNSAEDQMVNEFIEEINLREDAEAHMEIVDDQIVVFVGYYDENGNLTTGEIFGIEEIRQRRDITVPVSFSRIKHTIL